jgi:hypothetical protein
MRAQSAAKGGILRRAFAAPVHVHGHAQDLDHLLTLFTLAAAPQYRKAEVRQD